jgi:hypothetical protein
LWSDLSSFITTVLASRFKLIFVRGMATLFVILFQIASFLAMTDDTIVIASRFKLIFAGDVATLFVILFQIASYLAMTDDTIVIASR